MSCRHCPLAMVWKREVCRIFPYDFCLTKALMCYSLTGCNEHAARFCCFAAKTRNFASPKYSTTGSLNFIVEGWSWIIFLTSCCQVTFIPCFVCLPSPSRLGKQKWLVINHAKPLFRMQRAAAPTIAFRWFIYLFLLNSRRNLIVRSGIHCWA